jgi:chromosome segregation ATPase
MGIFDFFRSKKSVQEPKKIEFEHVKDFLAKEKQKIAESEIKSINIIKNNIKIVSGEFEEEISALNKIDLKERKVEQKIKLIVLENAKIFAGYIEKLKDKLEYLRSQRLEQLAREIDANFQDFKKKSFMSREKTSILIGKELGAVQKTIDSFYEDMNEILEDNKNLIETSGVIEKSESLCMEIEEIKDSEGRMQADSENASKTIAELENQEENLGTRMMQIKESEDYSRKLERESEFENEKNELKKGLAGLKSLINFKELAKIHHQNTKNMKIIKEYSDNINDGFEKDRGRSLLALVSKNKEEISEKISKIESIEKKISEFTPERDDVLQVQKEISIIKNKIQEAEEEKTRLEKKISSAEEKIIGIKAKLAQELGKIGIALIS